MSLNGRFIYSACQKSASFHRWRQLIPLNSGSWPLVAVCRRALMESRSSVLNSGFRSPGAPLNWPMLKFSAAGWNISSSLQRDTLPFRLSSSAGGRTRTVSGTDPRRRGLVTSNRRHLTLSTKAIVEASPLSLQPYLKLIRFDRPIGAIHYYLRYLL
jgi:hypothetical protein